MSSKVCWSLAVLCASAAWGRPAEPPDRPGAPQDVPARQAAVGLPSGGERLNLLRLPPDTANRLLAGADATKRQLEGSQLERLLAPPESSARTVAPTRLEAGGRSFHPVESRRAVNLDVDPATINQLNLPSLDRQAARDENRSLLLELPALAPVGRDHLQRERPPTPRR